MTYNLGFVFTNYNNSLDTIKTVDSIFQIKIDSPFIIIIVDNNSNSDQVNILQDLKLKYPDVILILGKENIGYFKGLNLGIKYINNLNIKIKYLVIGNNDLYFPQDFYSNLILNQHSFDNYPVISPNIITEDGIYQNPHVINKISKFREIMFDLYFMNYTLARIIKKIAKITNYFTDRSDEQHHNKSQIIYQGHGSCYILTPIFFENFEELYAPTFLMGEELFLSLQLRQQNFQLYYESNVKIVHKWHASINNIPGKNIWKIAKESHKVYRKYIKIF